MKNNFVASLVFMLWIVSGSACVYAQDVLVLTENSLGPLKLDRSTTVSVGSLRKIFPKYQVKHGIYSGDSPDFHMFEISTQQGELLFTITSFVDDEDQSRDEKGVHPVSIDVLEIVSAKIKDSFGLRVGDKVSDIERIRGKELEFSAQHHDVSLGANKIYYLLKNPSDRSPEDMKLRDVKRANWAIRSITWPQAAWD